MHDHPIEKLECLHDFKFCKDCNIVYCDKCKTEWGKQNDMLDEIDKFAKEHNERNKDFVPAPYTPISIYTYLSRDSIFFRE